MFLILKSLKRLVWRREWDFQPVIHEHLNPRDLAVTDLAGLRPTRLGDPGIESFRCEESEMLCFKVFLFIFRNNNYNFIIALFLQFQLLAAAQPAFTTLRGLISASIWSPT